MEAAATKRLSALSAMAPSAWGTKASGRGANREGKGDNATIVPRLLKQRLLDLMHRTRNGAPQLTLLRLELKV